MTDIAVKHSLCHQEPLGCIHEDGCSDDCRVLTAICEATKEYQVEIERLRALLSLAEEALSDLGACSDPDCLEQNCNHALPLIQAATGA